jgi:hypothetical protein
MDGRSSSVLWAEWRRGLKDLQNAVVNPWNGVTQTHEEPGTIANLTSQQITDENKGKSSYDAMREQYAARGQQQQEKPDLERG